MTDSSRAEGNAPRMSKADHAIVGPGWQLLLRSGELPFALDADACEVIRQIGALTADFGPGGDAEDLDGIYGAWFDRLGADAVLVRPDFYVFGSASLADVGALLNSARTMLGLRAYVDAGVQERRGW